MNMKFLSLALLAVASVQAHSHPQDSGTASSSAVRVPVDFNAPVELEVLIEVPSEQTPIEQLAQYLDKHGFSLHVKVAFKQSGQDLELQSKTVHARKSGTVSPEEFNAISKRVSELVREFGRSPKWTFRQQQNNSSQGSRAQ